MSTGSPNGPFVLARPPRLMARPMSTGSPNEYWLAQPRFLDIGGTSSQHSVEDHRLVDTRPRHLPGIEASPTAPPARHRSKHKRHLCFPASHSCPAEPRQPSIPSAPPARQSPAEPAPRSGFFPGKKMSRLSCERQPRHFLAPHRARHPAAPPARHISLQPAKPAPRSGFFHRGRDSDFARSVFRLRFFARKPSPGQRRRSGSDAVLAASLPDCFFHNSHAQPSILAWAQDCSLNPGAGTGLPEKPITGPAPKVRERRWPCSITRGVFFPTIHTPCRQSWRGHRIAPVSPRKHWERSAAQRCASRLAARIASLRRIWG